MFYAADAGVTLAHGAQYDSFESEIQPDTAQREDLELVQRVFASVPGMQLIFPGGGYTFQGSYLPFFCSLSKAVDITSLQLEVSELPNPFFPHEAAGVTARLVS